MNLLFLSAGKDATISASIEGRDGAKTLSILVQIVEGKFEEDGRRV